MSEIKKIIFASVKSQNEKFFNILDNNGIEYGIGKEKSPVLFAKMATLKPGEEFSADYFLWKDKHYLSDVKEGGGKGFGGNKSFAPKDKKWESAIAAAQTVGHMLALTKDATPEQFDKLFDHIHNKIMSCVTAPLAEPNK